MTAKRIPPTVFKLMLVSCALIWGASFTIMKGAITVMPPSWLVGVRFVISGALLSIILFPRMRKHFNLRTIAYGAALGLLIFGAYWFQTVGLVYTTPSKNAFLTDIYCVVVPFMFWVVAKRRPTRYNIAAAVLCIAGVGFVSLSSGDHIANIGDVLTIIGGLFFAAHIVATAVFSRTHDVVVMTVYQLWFSGFIALAMGALTEPMPDWNIFGDIDFLLSLGYLVIFASCIAYWFQNLAVAHVAPSQAAILLSLESIFGVVFSVALYGEALTVQLVIGFALIFGAITLSEAFPRKKLPSTIDYNIVRNAGRME